MQPTSNLNRLIFRHGAAFCAGNFVAKCAPLFVALILALVTCSTVKTVPGSTLTSGFQADAPFYRIVDFPAEGRQNVIRVNGADTSWAIVRYSLADYKGKEIAISIQADVKRTGAGGTLNWQVNNSPDYPSVSSIKDAAPGVWHRMHGKALVTPTERDPYLYLTNWENNARKTVYYIDNITVTIEEGGLTPDLALPPLKSKYANDFLIGNIVENAYTSGEYLTLLSHHYNVVTSTATYPSMLAPSVKTGAYQWANADMMVNLMLSKGIAVHGHVLVWHEMSPAWLTVGSRQDVERNVKDHITQVMTHFKGRIHSWDVVNEAIRDNLSAAEAAGDWKKCMRNSQNKWTENPWFDALGADYVEIAFRAARAADPNVTLYYNDYGLQEPNKAEAVCRMIKDINTRYRAEGNARNLIEGVGDQGHYYGLGFNVEDVRMTLEKLTSLGIEVSITELDISVGKYDPGNGRDRVLSEADAIAQGRIYARLFKLYREYAPHITRVTMWGMDDNRSWLSVNNPCLFDWKLNAKKAFHAVSDPDVFLAEYGN